MEQQPPGGQAQVFVTGMALDYERMAVDADYERLTNLKASFKGEYGDLAKKRSSSQIFDEEAAPVVGYIWSFHFLDCLPLPWRRRFERPSSGSKGVARAEEMRERTVNERCLQLEQRWGNDKDAVEITVVNMVGDQRCLRISRDATAGEIKDRLAALAGIPRPELALVCAGVAGAIGDGPLDDEDRLPSEALDGPAPHATMVRTRPRRALSGSHDGSLGLWDISTGERLGMMRGHGDAILSLEVDWSTRRALTGSHDCRIKMWDLDHCICVGTMMSPGHPAFCIAADWSARRAISGSWDRSLQLWDLDLGLSVSKLDGVHGGNVLCIAMHWPARRALSGAQDGMLRMWDLEELALLWTVQSTVRGVSSLVVDWALSLALAGTTSGEISVWKLPTTAEAPERIAVLEGHEQVVSGLALDAEGRQVVSASWDGTLRRWELPAPESSGKASCTAVLNHEWGDAQTCLAVDWSMHCAVSGSTKALRIWAFEGWEEDTQPQMLGGHEDGIACVAIEPQDAR